MAQTEIQENFVDYGTLSFWSPFKVLSYLHSRHKARKHFPQTSYRELNVENSNSSELVNHIRRQEKSKSPAWEGRYLRQKARLGNIRAPRRWRCSGGQCRSDIRYRGSWYRTRFADTQRIPSRFTEAFHQTENLTAPLLFRGLWHHDNFPLPTTTVNAPY